ncbi:DUF7518 family protein [Halococcus salifodinae]|uniref:Smc operon protein n=1 Tax=Halococcus salifodinae DSM 8989 TaxID=1227456 RepID=M0NBN5_9EURY|nr:hypothetical protein [Halococcus salifodinae]EMA55387.1 hypothetical protein C450_01434 [Halococcus salifodinae DSM 8989]
MSGNRVEELETRVNELKATVDGLTEELVETKDRLRELEADDSDDSEEYIEAGVGTTPETETDSSEASAVETAVEGDKHTENEEENTTEADDIIVA